MRLAKICSAVLSNFFILIAGTSQTLAAGTCGGLASSPLAEPQWHAEQCAAPWNPLLELGSPPGAFAETAYAHNLSGASDNFVTHALADFPGQTVVGTNTMSLFAYDFDQTATKLYALDDDTQRLGTVNLASGFFTPIGSAIPVAGHIWSGLTVDRNGIFYAASTDGFESSLYSINPVTGSASWIGTDANVATMIDISINCDGILYGHDIASDSIFTLDTTTGLATLVGSTGVDSSFAQGMDFDHDGTLYAWTYQGGGANIFGTIDLTTGALTALATDNPLGEFEGAVEATCAVAPVGGQFQVNTYTTNYQGYPLVASDSDGNYVVVWSSQGSVGTDTSGHSVQGQRYASDGSPMGGQIQANTFTPSEQFSSSVAMDGDGDFVVVWYSLGSAGTDSSSWSVQGQRYASDGSPAGGQFQINTYTQDFQGHAAVASHADGDFVVVWRSRGSAGTDSSSDSVQGQRFASDGSPLGGEFQVNTYTSDYQGDPSVAALEDGGFVVVWTSVGSSGTDSSGDSIQGQRYASDATPIGGEFQVNTYTSGSQSSSSIASDADGNFVVVWTSLGSGGNDSSAESVQGQRYASNGSPIDGEFQVNSYTLGDQRIPSVASDWDGDFVVTWHSDGSGGTDSSEQSIQGQRYDSDGPTVGGEFQINTYTMSVQNYSAVASDADGDFVVVWASLGSAGTDSSGESVQAQRFGDPCGGGGCLVFADDFESGSSATWSTSIP